MGRNAFMVRNHVSNTIKIGITAMIEIHTHVINTGMKDTGDYTVPRFTVHPVSGMHQLEIFLEY